ncbi:DLW-39 family protein [Arthrobacter bussei]|nr:DLW-39 family protein [Arthrobacter bussei]
MLIAAAAAAGLLVYKRWQDSEKSKTVWSDATDDVI